MSIHTTACHIACGLLCMKCLGITTAKQTSNLYTGSLVIDNGNRLWVLSNQIVQAIIHHYCAHSSVSGRSRSEMTDRGQQGQGTASAPNEPLNSLAHSTVANSRATIVCGRAKSCDAKARFPLYTDKRITNHCTLHLGNQLVTNEFCRE